MKVPKKIKDEIKLFCDLNKIKDIDEFILGTIQIGFNIEKYGNAPWKQEIEVEKEVIKEVIKEVPVEKIVEKEIVKEVTIEKEVFITDDKKVLELGDELNNLKSKYWATCYADYDKTYANSEGPSFIFKVNGKKYFQSLYKR